MKAFDPRICELGEGALWHPAREQFFWFDILGRKLLSRQGDTALEWQFDQMASAAAWIDQDRLLIATETGLRVLDLRDGGQQPVIAIEDQDPDTRSNDGRADLHGGFWIGTMGKTAAPGAGAIYRYYRGELRRLVQDVTIPNSICFSPDGLGAYYSDTREQRLWLQPLDRNGWPEGPRRLHLDFAAMGLRPDGAVVDSSGAICVACWGAGQVIRFARDGTRLEAFPVGGRHASCPAFGGRELCDLLVTTAHEGIDSPDPGQGLPYLTRVTVAGLPEPQVLL